MKPVNVIFDLDCTLVEVIYDKKEAAKLLTEGRISKDRIIYACDYPHYIYHGCREILQYAASITDYQLIFFSNAVPERNNELVPKLLANTFSGKELDNVTKKVKIYSRPDEIDTTELPDRGKEKYQPNYYGMYGQMKKDLRAILPEDQLNMTVIIEDDRSYITKGQEKTLLLLNGNDIYIGGSINFIDLDREEIEKFSFSSHEYGDKFPVLNKLIYGAGVLSKAYEMYQQENKAFTDILWSIQFIRDDNSSMFDGKEIDWWNAKKKAKFYDQGLKTLRKFNDKLTFQIIKRGEE